jgi:hypothetical protein
MADCDHCLMLLKIEHGALHRRQNHKLHAHWRLAVPARGAELEDLKLARTLAARLVGGDPSNMPIVHPIRWPGSWHRKAEPRLCEIGCSRAALSKLDMPTSGKNRPSR